MIAANAIDLIRRLAGFGMFLVAFLSAGCLQPMRAGEGDHLLILATSSGPKELSRCGYYAARQVIEHYGHRSSLGEKTFDPAELSAVNDTLGLVRFVRQNIDENVWLESGSWDGLLARVAGGDPVVVFLPLGTVEFQSLYFFGIRKLHAIVVAGFDREREKLFFYSDGSGPFQIDAGVFQEGWKDSGSLALRIGSA